MAIYGGPDVGIEYTFIAVRPFAAEHPIGSGKIVYYEPGDPFPGEDWGNAAFNLVEVGKAVRLAVNVKAKEDAPEAESTTEAADLEAEVVDEVEIIDDEFPVSTGSGWYTLSDGTRIRGEEAALQAQADLDEAG